MFYNLYQPYSIRHFSACYFWSQVSCKKNVYKQHQSQRKEVIFDPRLRSHEDPFVVHYRQFSCDLAHYVLTSDNLSRTIYCILSYITFSKPKIQYKSLILLLTIKFKYLINAWNLFIEFKKITLLINRTKTPVIFINLAKFCKNVVKTEF